MSKPAKYGTLSSAKGVTQTNQHSLSSNEYPKKLEVAASQPYRNSEDGNQNNARNSQIYDRQQYQQSAILGFQKAQPNGLKSPARLDDQGYLGLNKSNSSLYSSTSSNSKQPSILPTPKKFTLPFQINNNRSPEQSNYVSKSPRGSFAENTTPNDQRGQLQVSSKIYNNDNTQQLDTSSSNMSRNNYMKNSNNELAVNDNRIEQKSNQKGNQNKLQNISLTGDNKNSLLSVGQTSSKEIANNALNQKNYGAQMESKEEQFNVFLKPQQDQNESFDFDQVGQQPDIQKKSSNRPSASRSASNGQLTIALHPPEISIQQSQGQYQIQNPQEVNFSELRCRVHTSKPISKVCLDQYCDYQRLLCVDCEYTEHYSRHKQKCVYLSQLMSKEEHSFNLANWPQDAYLKVFQTYLKGQSNDFESRIIELCNKTLNIMKEKMEEIASNLLKVCHEEKKINEGKLSGLAKTYLDNCCELDGVRDIVEQIAECQLQGINKQLIAEKERQLGQLITDILNRQQEFKGLLNQQFGFRYFESPKLASPSIIDFSLIEQEFNNLKTQLTQMNVFLQKNIAPSLINKQLQPFEQNIDTLSWTNSSYGISFSTTDGNKEKIDFKPDEKSISVKRSKQPVFFFSSVLPQQTHLQIRLTAPLKCGTYLGIVIDSQRGTKVSPNVKSTHFVGACMGCPKQIFGQCRREGPGIDLFNKITSKVMYSDDEGSEDDDFEDKRQSMTQQIQGIQQNRFKGNNGTASAGKNQNSMKKSVPDRQDEDQDDQEEIVAQVEIINVFVNLKKKVLIMSDLSEKRYLKFDLDDKTFFYNNSIRFFVQTNNQILVELLQCNFL